MKRTILFTTAKTTEFFRDQSGQGKAELGNALRLAAVAVVILMATAYAAQNGMVQSLPDQMFHKLRLMASSSSTY